MWIFTVNGFFTIIQDRKDPNYVWLRARLREDIERNFPGVEVTEHPGADYLFRAKLPREQVATRVMELVMENNVTSHFKDVMIRTASKPEHGSRSNMLYGVWNSGGAMQPYAPYSKTPRQKSAPVFKPSYSQHQGQQSSQGLYGGPGAGRRASEFDWDTHAWGSGGGVSYADPAPAGAPSQQMTDEEFEAWWAGLSATERDAFLDEAENDQRHREAMEEDFGAATRAVEIEDVRPDPRNRPGNRRQRRKEKRRNKHNQYRDLHEETKAQRNRDGLNGLESKNRQAYLDNQAARRNGKGA